MDGDGPAEQEEASGHRAVPHTADLRIEAWGPTREQCLGEAVLGLVDSFVDLSGVRASAVQQVRLDEASDDDLLASLLDEVVYLVDACGEVPVDVEVETFDGELDVRLAMADLSAVPVTGAAPKAVSWNELHLGRNPYGWWCTVTVDV